MRSDFSVVFGQLRVKVKAAASGKGAASVQDSITCVAILGEYRLFSN